MATQHGRARRPATACVSDRTRGHGARTRGSTTRLGAAGRADRRDAGCLCSSLARRAALGRRRAPDAAGAAIVERALADLVRRRRHAAVLPDHAFRLLADAAAVGQRHARLSPRQHPAARDVRISPLAPAAPARSSRRAPRGRRLRAAPGAGRVGGVDDRAEEHALGRAVPGRRAGLPPVRSPARSADLWAGAVSVRAVAPRQERGCRPPERCSSSAGGARP